MIVVFLTFQTGKDKFETKNFDLQKSHRFLLFRKIAAARAAMMEEMFTEDITQ